MESRIRSWVGTTEPEEHSSPISGPFLKKASSHFNIPRDRLQTLLSAFERNISVGELRTSNDITEVAQSTEKRAFVTETGIGWRRIIDAEDPITEPELGALLYSHRKQALEIADRSLLKRREYIVTRTEKYDG